MKEYRKRSSISHFLEDKNASKIRGATYTCIHNMPIERGL